LFDILAELRAEAWTMLLVGGATVPEYLEACRGRVAELGLSEKIVFLGAYAQVPQLLRSVDFGVLTSKSESGPLALLEYVASGLPFVSTRVGLVGNALHEMEIPTLVEPGDKDGFVDGLRALFHIKPKEHAARVERAMQLATPRFDIQSVMAEWHALYAKVLGNQT
jgi:glycosyltransferase involved in cell wall biosynthesis